MQDDDFILAAQVVQVALVVRVEHVVQVAQVVQGDKTCHAMESKALRFFPKINQSFITQRRIHMSKFYKVLLVVSLFLTVIATSAITTVIISPSSAQASSYFADDVHKKASYTCIST